MINTFLQITSIAPLKRGRLAVYIVVFVALVIRNYSGNRHIFYADLYQHIRNAGSYANDIFITQSFVLDSSSLYDVVRVTGLNLDNDIIGMSLYFVFVTIATCSVWLILRQHFKIQSLDVIFAVILLITTLQDPLLRSVKAGIFFPFSSTPTTFAYSLMFPFIYLVLRRQLLPASLISSLMFALTAKPSWAPLLIAIFAVAIDRQTPKRHLIWFFMPIVVAILLSGNIQLPSEHAIRMELVEAVILHDHMENIIHIQPVLRLTLFVLSFPLFFFLTTKIKDHRLRNFCWSIGIVTIAIALIGGAYTAWGYKLYPNPVLFILSPLRATNVYHLFFILLSFNYIMNLQRFNWYQRSGAILSIFLLTSQTPSTIRLLLVAAIVACTVIISVIDHILTSKPKWIETTTLKINARSSLIVALLIITFISLFTVRDTFNELKTWNRQGFEHLQKWTIRDYDPAVFESLVHLRSCDDDFVLAVLDKPSEQYAHFLHYDGAQVLIEANFIARKSKFIGDVVHFYFNLPAYHEARYRETLAENLAVSLEQGLVPPPHVIEALKKKSVAVLMPGHLAAPIPKHIPTKTFVSGTKLVVFEENQRITNQIAQCGLELF